MDARFLEFQLEGKVKVWPPGNVMNENSAKQLIPYVRRKYKGKGDIYKQKGK